MCGSHFVFYGLAVFGPERRSPSTFDYGRNLSDSAIDTAMLVGLVGLLSIWIGRMAAVHFAMRKTFQLPFLEMGTHTPVRIQALLLLGTAANLFGVPFFGTVVWNISVVAFSTLPLAAFLWLLLARRVRRLTKLDFLLGIAFLVTRLISGPRFHASLGTVVVPLFLTGLAYSIPQAEASLGDDCCRGMRHRFSAAQQGRNPQRIESGRGGRRIVGCYGEMVRSRSFRAGPMFFPDVLRLMSSSARLARALRF